MGWGITKLFPAQSNEEANKSIISTKFTNNYIELGEEEGSFSTLGTLDILMQSDMLHLIFTLEKKVMKFMAQIFPRITFLQGNIKY